MLLAGGAVAYAYRPWPWLWSVAGLVGAAFAAWVPDVIRRRAWRPRMTFAAALAGAIIVYGVVACLNASSAYDPAAGQPVAVPHVRWLPSAADASNAWPSLAGVAAALAAMLMASEFGKSARLRRRLLAGVAVGGAFTAAYGIAERLPGTEGLRAWDRGSPWFEGESFGLLGYHNHAATLMNLAMPALAAVALGASRRSRIACSVGIAGLALGAAANLSRTGLAIGGPVAALSVAVLWLPRGGLAGVRRWAWPVAGGAAVLGLLAAVLFVARPAVVGRFAQVADGGWGSYFPRTLHWRAGLELVARSPVLGSGVGGYRMLAATTSTRGYYLGPAFVPGGAFNASLNVMNDYLQTLVEWGIAGSAMWVTLLVGVAVNATRAVAAPAVALPAGTLVRRELALVAVAAFSIFAHALVDPPLQAPAFQLIAGVLAGLLLAAPSWRGRSADPIGTFFA